MNKIRMKVLFSFLFSLSLLCSCNNHDKHGLNLMLNGRLTGAGVDWKSTDAGMLIDVSQFMQGVGGRFVPLNMNKGVVAQYGKRIGFSSNGSAYGMVQVNLCKMEPPSREDEGRLWVPVGFLEAVLEGDITVKEAESRIIVSAPAPQRIGGIVPEAGKLSSTLEKNGYTVQQGDICLSNAIDICYAGYSPNANGNNAGFPYFTIQMPLPPDAEHAIVPPQFVFSLREDEGFILIGKTPPACDYYSYRSYFLNRCVSRTNPFDRKKIYTQLGDPINSYNIHEDIFYPVNGGNTVKPFESFFIIVSTPDRQLYEDVLAAVTEAGLDQGNVLLDIIDANLVKLGNDDFADTIHFLHRFSNPHDSLAEDAYLKRPTLEILRLTPNTPRQANFLTPFTPRKRGSGITENDLLPAIDQLRQAIIDEYSDNYTIRELETHIWLEKTGAEAIDALEDVLGETRDTLYLNTDSFNFNQDTIVVVYGVNHTLIPKSVYNNVSCYGAKYANGFGGITNYMYNGNVPGTFPLLKDVTGMEKLYVWKFARENLDAETFAVPQDVNGDLKGLNWGEEAFMAFRIYIDPDSPDLLGPDPNEIIFDRAMVLTPR
jgi:hypothetical protein